MTTTENTDKALQAMAAATAAVKQLHGEEARLRGDFDALVAERRSLATSYEPLETMIATMKVLVETESARWRAEAAGTITASCSGRYELRSNGALREHGPGPLAIPRHGVEGLTLADLCGLAPDMVKAALEDSLRSTDSVTFGALPMKDRAARLAELDRQIIEAEAAHTHLVKLAHSSGVTLPLLPSVKAKREAEKAKAQREAQQTEAREKARAAVDASFAGAPEPLA